MTEQESVEVQLARIDGRLKNIEDKLGFWTQCRHVTRDGNCDFFDTVVTHDRQLNKWQPDIEKIDEHDKKINQWTGAMTAVSLISSFIGGLIAFFLTKVWK